VRRHRLALIALLVLPVALAAAEAGDQAERVEQILRRIEAVRASNLSADDQLALIEGLERELDAALAPPAAEPVAEPAVAPVPAQPRIHPVLVGRRVTINGAAPKGDGLAALERALGTRIPDGDYWYDPIAGACGFWGMPCSGFLPAGLDIAEPLPREASAGTTGVIINNREIHLVDLMQLNQLLFFVGKSLGPGRYHCDADGDIGPEGGQPAANLVSIMTMAAVAQAFAGAGGGGGGSGHGGGGGDNYWSSRYGAGNEQNGFGYVSIPGTGSVSYGP